MQPLYGALPEPYVPVRVTRCDFVAQRYTYDPSCCRTSQDRRTFIHLSVFLWNELGDLVFDCVLIYWPKLPFFSSFFLWVDIGLVSSDW